MSAENVKEVVREKYGKVALRVTSGAGNSCCGDDRSGPDGACDPITSNLYDAAQEGEAPDTAIRASLGCGNPTARMGVAKLLSLTRMRSYLKIQWPIVFRRRSAHLRSHKYQAPPRQNCWRVQL
jgi:hypothetical protein